MGSRPGESGREAAEIPHQVTISKGFYLGKYEVTQGQWNILMGNNPSWHQQCGDDCPVEGISLVDIEEFLVELNDHSGTHLVASGDSGE